MQPADSSPPAALPAALPGAAREVEQFVAAGGWDQPPQLFALVPTAQLLAAEPGLAGQLDAAAPLTSVAQEALPAGELDEALAGIIWPDTVAGCALAQEILVLPPEAEPEIGDGTAARRLAAQHPQRREARLVAAVLRDGAGACVLRLRAVPDASGADDQLLEHPDLAPNLLAALHTTLQP